MTNLSSFSSKRLRGCVAALGVLALTASCAVGPDFLRPRPPAVSGYTPGPLAKKTAAAPVAAGEAQSYAEGMDISHQWWEVFRSKQLNALLTQSLKNNPDLQAAEEALRVAQENVKAQQGFFFPTIQAGYSPSRTELAGNEGGNSPGVQGNGAVIATTSNPPASAGGTPPFNAPVFYTFHTSEVTVGYVPDVFGLNRRTVESLKAQAESQRFQLAAVYVTLTSNVVAAAVQEASLRAQIAATEDLVRINTDMLDILRKQYSHGYVMQADVAAQEAQLGQVLSTLPPLQKQLAQGRDLLTALACRYSAEEVSEKFSLADLHLPRQLPLSLPSRLVEQRPDVRSAEEQMHSASAQIGVAVANILPQFSINGALGGEASVFSEQFWPSGQFFSLIGNVTQTIFDGGTLLHRKRGAEAAYKQAALQYRSTVITAFQNVADTLRAIQYDASNLKAASYAERATKVTLDVTRDQFKAGFTTYSAVLMAEQAYQQARINTVQAQANRFADTAALFQALGGGWWNQPPAVKAAASQPPKHS